MTITKWTFHIHVGQTQQQQKLLFSKPYVEMQASSFCITISDILRLKKIAHSKKSQ